MSKKLIPLIVILVILGGLVIWRNNAKETPTLIEQTKLEALVPQDLKAKQVDRLELFSAAKPEEKVVIEREDDAWKVASHFNAPAKADTVDEYLEKVLKVKGEFRAQADTDAVLEEFSLKDDEAFRVQAFTKAGEEPAVDLLVGKSPKYRTVFLRKAGDNRIFVESTNLRQDAGVYGDEMDKAPTADKWLDKDILKLEKDKVTKVALTMPGKELVFEKQGKEVEEPEKKEEAAEEEEKEGEEDADAEPKEEEEVEKPKKIVYEWILASGGAQEKHKEKGLDSLLSKLSSLSASKIVDPEKKADWGLDEPAFKAVISIEDGEDVIIEGGRPDPSGAGYVRLALAEREVVYEVSKYNFDPLFPKGEDLFDLPKLDLDNKQLTRIEIEQSEGKIVAVKEGEDWKVVEPVVDLEVQKSPLTTLASTVAKWQAADYADAGTGTGEFARKVTITAGDATHTITLADDSKAFDGAYARLDDNDAILAMKSSDVKKVFLRPRDVYTLKLLGDIDETETIAVEIKHGDTLFSLTRDEDAWNLNINDGTFDADIDKCEDFLSDLADLQADNFRLGVSPEDVAINTSVTVKMNDNKTVTCAFSAEQDGRYLMTVAGKSTVFEVTKDDGDGLFQQLEALQAPKVAPEPEPSAEETAATSEETEAASEEAAEAPAEIPAAPEAAEAAPDAAEAAPAVSIQVPVEAPATPQAAETPAP